MYDRFVPAGRWAGIVAGIVLALVNLRLQLPPRRVLLVLEPELGHKRHGHASAAGPGIDERLYLAAIERPSRMEVPDNASSELDLVIAVAMQELSEVSHGKWIRIVAGSCTASPLLYTTGRLLVLCGRNFGCKVKSSQFVHLRVPSQ